jgi:hypothetical protein
MQNAIEAMAASENGGRNLMLETKRQDQGEVIISVQDSNDKAPRKYLMLM